MNCNLHFIVVSWDPNWPPKDMHCPECGEQKHFARWYEASQLQVFEVVPGTAQLVTLRINQ
jgi:transposase